MHRARRVGSLRLSARRLAQTLPLIDWGLGTSPSGSSENMVTTPYTPRTEVGRKLRGEQSLFAITSKLGHR
jgi:hypothetical protein